MNGAGDIAKNLPVSGNGLKLKICGITDRVGLDAACGISRRVVIDGVALAADFVGFVFCEPTKTHRYLTPDQAEGLVRAVPHGIQSVGLFVNPSDDEIAAYVAKAPVTMLQLHGQETPERVAAIKARFGLPVIKALHIFAEDDVDHAEDYREGADYYLFDAKTSGGASGGRGVAFDWDLLKNRSFSRPWFLAGGLSADTVQEAWARSGAAYFDCSSGVETDKKKDPLKIDALLRVMDDMRQMPLEK